MKVKEKEILASCCAFGSDGTEEVHVLESVCPIKRELGKRNNGPDCTCIYYSGFHRKIIIPPCEHYKGVKKVQSNKKREYKVQCSAVES
jgi:hypothetical protein